jgi:hypothetical protein
MSLHRRRFVSASFGLGAAALLAPGYAWAEPFQWLKQRAGGAAG